MAHRKINLRGAFHFCCWGKGRKSPCSFFMVWIFPGFMRAKVCLMTKVNHASNERLNTNRERCTVCKRVTQGVQLFFLKEKRKNTKPRHDKRMFLLHGAHIDPRFAQSAFCRKNLLSSLSLFLVPLREGLCHTFPLDNLSRRFGKKFKNR